MKVRAKKSLGQHFLKDESVAFRIVESLYNSEKSIDPTNILELGPGTGVLTKYLLKIPDVNFKVVEIDRESTAFLRLTYPQLEKNIMEEDFLRCDLSNIFGDRFCIIGNFPYNISSQIFFKILEDPDRAPVTVCMIQKEVAERLSSPPGKKAYGILSVLLQMWYNIDYLFTVEPHVFDPPPKVRSSVIKLTRNERKVAGCDTALLKSVVKTTFNQRRKTIRNSIKPLIDLSSIENADLSRFLSLRPEQLSVDDFIILTNIIASITD